MKAVNEPASEHSRTVRVGFVGAGGRGVGLLGDTLKIEGVEVVAVWDLHPDRATAAAALVEKAGHARPQPHTQGDRDWERLIERDDLDAVIITTPWQVHAEMSVLAMTHGKYVGVEVPCAVSVEECWQLVDTSEQTGVPCMMLENWSFRRDNLAVLKMIRAGMFGQIVHCHCSHSHNCIGWYMDEQGYPRWGGKHLLERCADHYPTHSLGPVLSWMDINCGDRFETVVSMASGQWGLTDQLRRRFGPDHPPANYDWKQGDVITTLVRTAKGRTVVINMDMQLPRPYDNRWLIQGTRGLYDEAHASVYLAGLEGNRPAEEQWEPFGPYQAQYDHAWWRGKDSPGGRFGLEGHGGVDPLQLQLFYDAVRNQSPPPIDVYDSVVMSVIVPLSERSISSGSQPVQCPDFTRGRWETNKPAFAVVAE